MTITTAVTSQTLVPFPARLEADIGHTDLVAHASLRPNEFAAAWHQALGQATEQAPALAANLGRLIAETPDALPLYLANLTSERQREMGVATMALARAGDQKGADLLGAFEQVLRQSNDGAVTDNQTLLARYSKYIVALSELMTRVNAHVVAESDGKSNINGLSILDELSTFCNEWQGDNGILGVFANEKDAKALEARFRGGTVEIFGTGNQAHPHGVRFAFSKLAPIVNAISGNGGFSRLIVDEHLKKGLPPPSKAEIQNGKASQGGFGLRTQFPFSGEIRSTGINSHGVQGLSLATGDVQKTHQTDLDLLLNEFSRSISQFDNLVKLYSSLATALTETCKSFL